MPYSMTFSLDDDTVNQLKEMFPGQELTTSVTVELPLTGERKILWAGSVKLYIEYSSHLDGLVKSDIRLEQICRDNGSLVFYAYNCPDDSERKFYVKKILRIIVDGVEISIRDFLADCGIEYHGGYKVDKSKFQNGTICFTGTFHKPRAEIEKQTESHGFNATHAVTPNTDYLVIGEELHGDKSTYSLSKIKTALALKVPIITEDELLDLL